MPTPTVSILSTGNELITGLQQDTNGAQAARELTDRGFTVRRLATTGDESLQLYREIERLGGDSDYLIISGGLGPTADDQTREAIARAAGVKLTQNQDALDNLKERLHELGIALKDGHARQALLPEGADVFPNQRGTAPGFACKINGCLAIALPGVPSEFQHMFHTQILPFLEKSINESGRKQGAVAFTRLHIFGLPESVVNDRLKEIMTERRNPLLGLTVKQGTVSIHLRAHGDTEQEAWNLIEQDEAWLRSCFGKAIYGRDDETLAGTVAGLLRKRSITLAVAESCTGGQIGSMLVEVPGISHHLPGDIVAYSNRIKTSLLGVPEEEIQAYGAVCPQVARSMARGICKATGADIGISTTGIAGPSGGTPEKPVGLVYVGLHDGEQTRTYKLNLHGDRHTIKDRAAHHALNFVRLALLEWDS